MTRRARVASVVALLALTTAACLPDADAPARPFESVEELFDEAGGEEWCGTELRVTLAPAVGSCGPDDARVAMATAYLDEQQLTDSVRNAIGDPLLVLAPNDVDAPGPWFELRSADRSLLEEAQRSLGGEILDGDAAIEAWLTANGA